MRKKRKKDNLFFNKFIYILIYIIVLFVLLKVTSTKDYSEIVNAKIIDSVSYNVESDEGRETKYSTLISYIYDGVVYKEYTNMEVSSETEKEIGDNFDIYINPDNPKDFIYQNDYTMVRLVFCGLWSLFFIIGWFNKGYLVGNFYNYNH